MKIINFSNAAAQPFLAVPAQALGPWISRIKNSIGYRAGFFSQDSASTTMQPHFAPDAREASNDSFFAPGPDVPALPCQAAFPTSSGFPSSRLRVVRESDAAISPDCAGRMVISGRMADVCAELERMALRAETPIEH